MKRVRSYRPLNKLVRLYLCEFICTQLPTARDVKHPMRPFARKLIALAMWRWTADGLDDNGAIKRDAFKYDVKYHPASRSAVEERMRGRANVLRHEHVVPRMFTADHIIRSDLDADQTFELLSRFCRAAIVTSKEDRQLPRTMPKGWSWLGGNPYARYHCRGLVGELTNLPDEFRGA